jgi:UDP-GlcNAc3NAcA epimerase
MKILTVLGARPQFIKAAAVSRAIAQHNESNQQQVGEIILHTGQHFDANMSDVFFEQMVIPKPDYHLNINGLSHGSMTGRMLEEVEKVIQKEKPDWVLVYGDTNSTLAGALAAAKLHVPIAHVEAGLRSNNLAMPEEVNRVLTDRISTILFCPTGEAIENLKKEGFPFTIPGKKQQLVENAGDVMFDVVLYYQERALKEVSLNAFGIVESGYALCTLHRQENTDDPKRMQDILWALRQINKDCPVVLPLHPRTKRMIVSNGNEHWLEGIKVFEPLPYLEMQRLEMGSRLILTDSGGIQKEAFFHRVPCVTLRDETEWVETVGAGVNLIAGANPIKILEAFEAFNGNKFKSSLNPFGNGAAAQKIIESLLKFGVKK